VRARWTVGGVILGARALRLLRELLASKKRRGLGRVPDMLKDGSYNPEAVHKAFEAGLKEMTGRKTLRDAWASLVSPEDVVGIRSTASGLLKSRLRWRRSTKRSPDSRARVKDNNIIVWDRTDREVAGRA